MEEIWGLRFKKHQVASEISEELYKQTGLDFYLRDMEYRKKSQATIQEILLSLSHPHQAISCDPARKGYRKAR